MKRKGIMKREEIMDEVAAIMAIEGFILTEEDKENVRRLVDGEIDVDTLVKEIIEKNIDSETPSNE